MDHSSQETTLPKWEKVLWKKQPYPDNYIDPSFLSSLKRNSNVRDYSYASVVLAASAVAQHLASIFVFIAVFIFLNTQRLDPRLVIWGSVAVYPLGHVLWELLDWADGRVTERRESRLKATKASILILLILITTSPVLKTLTEATSFDSIWALSSCLFGLNAILADYSAATPFSGKERLTSVLSMNAAVSASVVLASRLRSNLEVFALVLFAIIVFALFPLLRRRIQYRAYPGVRVILTLLLATAAAVSFTTIYTPAALMIAAGLLFVNLACPAFFIWAQQFKNEIKGPWDPAVPQIRSPVQ